MMKVGKRIIDEVITTAVGGDVLPLVNVLKDRKGMLEADIAVKMKLDINRTRQMLYRLYHKHLVTCHKEKDKQKGWYLYSWAFNTERVLSLAKDQQVEKLSKLGEKLKRETQTSYFICTNRCTRLDFDDSMSFEFKCPECGSLMGQDDNATKIKELKQAMSQIS
ncbi:hypothetical protein HZB02_05440 [Candidatus Woesearchaeota archaeon]|nr:hypothetical protein [Candidatus Woesearchaeota archaeon]